MWYGWLQISGDFTWAETQVATMQRSCVDDILMMNYTDVNDTQSVNEITSRAVEDVISRRCEPFDCNRHGRCTNRSCVCHAGTSANMTHHCFSCQCCINPLKEVYLYSAILSSISKRSDTDHAVYLQITPCSPFLRKRSPDVATTTEVADI